MKAVAVAVSLALAAGITLAGICRAEEKDMKPAEPSAAETQKTETPAEKKQSVKLTEEEAKKIVAARVNGVDITLDQVIQMVAHVSSQMAMTFAHTKEMPTPRDIEEDAYDRLIANELAYQKAKAEGIKVDKSAVDAAIEKIRTGMGEEKYKELLSHDKTAEQTLRAQVEKDLMIKALYDKEVVSKVSVSKAQMKEEYEKGKKTFVQPERISLVDVIIPLHGAEEKGVEGKAQDILKKIRENGDDPNKLANDGSFAVRDYAPDKDKDKELIEAARKLKKGEISGIIKASDGLHIIKLADYVPEKQLTFDEVKAFIEYLLKSRQQAEKTKEWVENLKKDAKIEIILHEIPK
jgi:foldase protein PrsA